MIQVLTDILSATAIVIGIFLLITGAYLIAVSFSGWLGVGRSRKTRRP